VPLARGRAGFIARLDGLAVGENPAHGVFFGSRFLHPDLDVALDMPVGWKTIVGPSGAGATAPDGDAVVALTVVGPGEDPVGGAKTDGLPEGQLKRLQRRQIGTLPAAALVVDTRDGDRLLLTWIAHRSRVFRVTGLARVGDWKRYGRDFERVTASARPPLAADRDRIVESRLRIRRATDGETVMQMAARGEGPWSAAHIAVANGIAAGARLEAGWPVKVPVTQRYRGTSG
jgi:predicted Zn-dependent protease